MGADIVGQLKNMDQCPLGMTKVKPRLEDTLLSTIALITTVNPVKDFLGMADPENDIPVGHQLSRIVTLRPPVTGGVTEAIGASARLRMMSYEQGLTGRRIPVDTALALTGIFIGCINPERSTITVSRASRTKFETVLRLATNCSLCPNGRSGSCEKLPQGISLVEI